MRIAPTADAVRAALDRAEERLTEARAIVRRPLTLSDKILLGRLDATPTEPPRPGESILALRPDRVALQDISGQSVMLQFMQSGRDRVAAPTSVHCDHLIQARAGGAEDLREALVENDEVFAFLRSAAARFGAGFWPPGAGIIHQVLLETYATPGMLLIGTDSHTPNAGGVGCLGVGVGGADAVEVMAGMPWELLYPKRIAVVLSGALSGWAAPKDVVLWVAGQIGSAGATNAVVEYIGPGAASLSATGKATICNMGAELGATSALFAADARIDAYLRATDRADAADALIAYADLLAPDPEALADPEAVYNQVLRLDLSALEPLVSGPHAPDRVRPLSQLKAEVAAVGTDWIDAIDTALIGSCTNSSYEDMGRAADIAEQARGAGLQSSVPLLITPGSERIRATIERDGQMTALRAIGGSVLANACGPCIGQWRRAQAADAPNTIVTSYNRNFPARNDGSAATMNFIASPEVVTALALAGRLSFDPQTDALPTPDGGSLRLAAPKPAPDIPASGFAANAAAYAPPPEDGRGVEVAIRPGSTRLQRLAPWPAADAGDFDDMLVLARTEDGTTTDAISPAGPWLAYRGHLERLSDNLLMGAVDAATGRRGVGDNALDGATDRPFAEIARAYRSAGRPWLIVGGRNYGAGSSREHAAMSPRLLGCRAVIAESFARIHETNLKKQGLLALRFADRADAAAIAPGDRFGVEDIRGFAPGADLRCRIHHADGSETSVALAHSYTARQIRWFWAGSAMNAARAENRT